MDNKIKDLEVLKQYLSDNELKEVARKVAYDAFKSSIGVENPHNKDNINFYISQGAYEAVKQHITEGGFKEEEFVEPLREKVSGVIKNLSYYNLPLDGIIEEVVEEKRDEIRSRVDEVWSKIVNEKEDKYDSLYSRISQGYSGYIQDYLIEIFEESLKIKFKNEN